MAAGDPRFFLGTDSAPHARGTKEAACGCAGIYSAHAALELYAEAFEADRRAAPAGSLCQRVRSALLRPAAERASSITLEKRDWTGAAVLPFAGETIVPLRAGGTAGAWRHHCVN